MKDTFFLIKIKIKNQMFLLFLLRKNNKALIFIKILLVKKRLNFKSTDFKRSTYPLIVTDAPSNKNYVFVIFTLWVTIKGFAVQIFDLKSMQGLLKSVPFKILAGKGHWLVKTEGFKSILLFFKTFGFNKPVSLSCKDFKSILLFSWYFRRFESFLQKLRKGH